MKKTYTPEQFDKLTPERRLVVAFDVLSLCADLSFISEGFKDIPAEAAPATAKLPHHRRSIEGAVGYYRPRFGMKKGENTFGITRHRLLRIWTAARFMLDDETASAMHKLGDIELIPSRNNAQGFEPKFTRIADNFQDLITELNPHSLRAQMMTEFVYSATHRALQHLGSLSEAERLSLKQPHTPCCGL